MTETMTARESRATCEACTLAEAMKDCLRCQFDYGTPLHATGADVFRMYRRLWGDDDTPQDFDVFRLCDITIGLLDRTQARDA